VLFLAQNASEIIWRLGCARTRWGRHSSWLRGKTKVKERIAVNGFPSHSCGVSPAIWDHTVLPATWHKWTCPALTPASKLVLDLPTPEGWKAELIGYPAMHRLGFELAIFRSLVRRPTTTLPSQPMGLAPRRGKRRDGEWRKEEEGKRGRKEKGMWGKVFAAVKIKSWVWPYWWMYGF